MSSITHCSSSIFSLRFFSGGAGYVLSKEALRRLAEKGHDPELCRQDDGPEDRNIGRCMENLGVQTRNSTDAEGNSRFHCMNPDTRLYGGYFDWFFRYDTDRGKYVSIKGFQNWTKVFSPDLHQMGQ